MVLHATKENFESEVLKSDTPVIVDFWAEWCGPCKMMAPVFEEISKDYEGKLKFVKLDTEAYPDTASQHGVQALPTLVVFKDGKEVDRIIGFADKGTLKGKIDGILEKA